MRSFTTRSNTRSFLVLAIGCVLAALVSYLGPLAGSHAAQRSAPPAKHGPATIVLQEGYDLPATYETERPAGAVSPTTLASADFDVDGYPDLVSGYATNGGGYLSFQRGNPEAFAPTLPENVEAISESRFPVSFLPDAKIIDLPVAPDFIVVGDFDRDTNPDVIAATRGGSEVYLAAGDGDGGFAPTRGISVPGRVTAMTAGTIDLSDGKTDLVVGLETESGAALMIYEGDDGLAGSPQRIALPLAAQQIQLGQLDDDLWGDAAMLTDGRVYVLHGRNQREGHESTQHRAAQLRRHTMFVADGATQTRPQCGPQLSSAGWRCRYAIVWRARSADLSKAAARQSQLRDRR